MRYEIDREERYTFETEGVVEFETIAQKHLAQVASSLTNISPVRLAFKWTIENENPFPEKDCNLEELSSVQPIICAAIIQEDKVLFLSPTLAYPLHTLTNITIIGYTKRKAQISYSPLDPFVGDLKMLGYGSGDRLKNETHPILFSE